MRYLITGGSGFLGSRFVARLLEEGNKVVVYDNLSTGYSKNLEPFRKNRNYNFVKGDITDKGSLKKAMAGIDMVYHLSAIVGVKEYCRDPLKVVDVNVIGTRNVLELALKNEIKVLFASTSEIFGKNPKTPWKEEDDRVLGSTKIDRWSYATSKAMCEHMLFAMSKNHGLSSVIVRFFNVYGPGQPPYFVISQSVQKVLKNEQPLLYDSGNQTRCFTFVDDAIEGAMLASKSKKAGGDVFNIGSNKETSIREAIEMVIEIGGKKGRLTWKNLDTKKHYGESYEDIPRRIPDVSKAKRILGWEAKTSLRDGIKKTINWAKQNKWWLELKN